MQLPTSVSIERATASDIEAVVELKLAMFVESGRSHLLPEDRRAMVAQDYEAMYAEDSAAHFVVRRSGAIISCAGAFLKSDLPYRYFTPPFYGFVGDVYTVPVARGAGLAKLLSEAAVAWLKSRGARTIRLLASEAARPIYISMGFRPTDEMVLHVK